MQERKVEEDFKREQDEPAPESDIWGVDLIPENGERDLMLRLEELARLEGLRDKVDPDKIPAVTQREIDKRAYDAAVLKKSGDVAIEGGLVFEELSEDPPDPDEGSFVIWMSDGTGSGDDGDILIKITAGGSTKTTTLVDFSTV